MDFLPNLRLQSLYGQAAPPQAPMTPPVPSPMEEIEAPTPYDVPGRMKELYTPETTATDRFNSLIENAPQYQRPSFLRTIAASLSAFGPGGHDTGMQVLNEPNTRAQNEWKTQIAPAQQAASLERQNNTNERTLAYQQVSNELKARADADRALKNERDAAIKDRRAAVYEWKAKLKDYKIIVPKGGNITAVNLNNPNDVITLTGPDGKPIPSGSISDTDRINIEQKNEEKNIGLRGEEARKTEETRQDNRQQTTETRGWTLGEIPDPNDPSKRIGVRMNQITGEIQPVTMGGKGVTDMTKIGTPGKGTGSGSRFGTVDMKGIRARAQETMQALNEIINDKDELDSVVDDAVGKSRMLQMHRFYGTDARAGETRIKNLKDRLLIDLLGELKTQSRTGATGFGQLSIKELGVLEGAASRLDPGMSEEEFIKALKEVRAKLNKIMQPGEGDEGNTTVAPKAPGKLSADDLLKKYGG